MNYANQSPELTRNVKQVTGEKSSLIEKANSARGRLILSIATAAVALFGTPDLSIDGASTGVTVHNPVTGQDIAVGISIAGKDEAIGIGVPQEIIDKMTEDTQLNVVEIGSTRLVL